MKKKLSTRVLIICSVVAIISLLVTTSIQSKISQISSERYQQTAKELTAQLLSAISEKQNALLYISLAFANGSALQDDIINNRLNKNSLDALPATMNTQANLKNIWVQIISKDGISLYRSWTDKKGDPIYKQRKDIEQMLKDHKTKQSISVGIYDLTFKTMIPIFKDNSFIGIFEVMGKFNSVSEAIESQKINLVILVDKSYKKQLKEPFSKIFINDYYVANVNANTNVLEYVKQKTPEYFIENKKEYICDEANNLFVVKYTMFDAHNKPMAHFLITKKLDEIKLDGLSELKYQIIIFVIFIIGMIVWPSYYVVNKKHKENILNINRSLKQRVNQQTIALKKQNEILQHQVSHDTLTGLPNRDILINTLNNNKHGTLMLINLDDFRQLNDFYGTEIGDHVIILVGKELKKLENHNTTVYKMPSDEFAIFISNPNELTTEDASRFLEKIAVSQTLQIESLGQEISVSFTMGIDSGCGVSLLAHADAALKKSKYARKHFSYYDESINPAKLYQKNIEWTQKIKLALLENRIVAYYQPIINNTTKETAKYEALVRFIDTDGTVVPPIHFLDIAKKSKLYHEITKTVLTQAIEIFSNKEQEVSINISYNDIVDANTKNFILESLQKASNSKNIVFEILENESIDNFETVASFIHSIKEAGAKMAIDDFGSGYSNFEALFNLNVDYLKIDGTLIKDITTNTNSKIIVETIVSFCEKLGIKCIAEFVHNEEVQNQVLALGIDFSQGYFFSTALSPDEIK